MGITKPASASWTHLILLRPTAYWNDFVLRFSAALGHGFFYIRGLRLPA
jgi:hypothetical protein